MSSLLPLTAATVATHTNVGYWRSFASNLIPTLNPLGEEEEEEEVADSDGTALCSCTYSSLEGNRIVGVDMEDVLD